jgi:hypothetical protein
MSGFFFQMLGTIDQSFLKSIRFTFNLSPGTKLCASFPL